MVCSWVWHIHIDKSKQNIPSLWGSDYYRAFSGWGEIFGGDVVVAAAMIDRLVHHAEVISLAGNSYRLRGKEKLTNEVSADQVQ